MHPREVAVVGALVLAVFIPWVTARDVWRHPVERWRAAGRSRVVTTVLVIVVPLLGPAWYVRRVRPTVRVDGGPRVAPWRRVLRRRR